jgi:hypothetical protein
MCYVAILDVPLQHPTVALAFFVVPLLTTFAVTFFAAPLAGVFFVVAIFRFLL